MMSAPTEDRAGDRRVPWVVARIICGGKPVGDGCSGEEESSPPDEKEDGDREHERYDEPRDCGSREVADPREPAVYESSFQRRSSRRKPYVAPFSSVKRPLPDSTVIRSTFSSGIRSPALTAAQLSSP